MNGLCLRIVTVLITVATVSRLWCLDPTESMVVPHCTSLLGQYNRLIGMVVMHYLTGGVVLAHHGGHSGHPDGLLYCHN